jgi:hypothetical protein
MDIDRVARALAISPTRRGVTHALAGLATVAGLHTTAGQDAAAKKCKPCRKKKQNGTCKGKKPDNSPCPGDGKCFDGKCVPKPNCLGTGEPCEIGQDDACCSESCSTQNPVDPVCFISFEGKKCLKQSDCQTGTDCIGYRCRVP